MLKFEENILRIIVFGILDSIKALSVKTFFNNFISRRQCYKFTLRKLYTMHAHIVG